MCSASGVASSAARALYLTMRPRAHAMERAGHGFRFPGPLGQGRPGPAVRSFKRPNPHPVHADGAVDQEAATGVFPWVSGARIKPSRPMKAGTMSLRMSWLPYGSTYPPSPNDECNAGESTPRSLQDLRSLVSLIISVDYLRPFSVFSMPGGLPSSRRRRNGVSAWPRP